LPNFGSNPIAEAKLAEHIGINPQPLDEPNTHYPGKVIIYNSV
jgi:hypothetical protein